MLINKRIRSTKKIYLKVALITYWKIFLRTSGKVLTFLFFHVFWTNPKFIYIYEVHHSKSIMNICMYVIIYVISRRDTRRIFSRFKQIFIYLDNLVFIQLCFTYILYLYKTIWANWKVYIATAYPHYPHTWKSWTNVLTPVGQMWKCLSDYSVGFKLICWPPCKFSENSVPKKCII